MTNKEPIAFENERAVVAKKGVKIGSKSRFNKEIEEKKAAEEAAKNFEEKANAFMKSRQESDERGVNIVKRLMAMLRDKTVPSNKGVVALNAEKELREDLSAFVQLINNDPNQSTDGHGSLTAIAIIVKVLFEMRDRNNVLEFELEQLKSIINSGEKDG